MASEGTGAFRSGKTNRRSVVRPNNTTASTATPMRIRARRLRRLRRLHRPLRARRPFPRVTRGGMSSLVEPKGMVFTGAEVSLSAAPGAGSVAPTPEGTLRTHDIRESRTRTRHPTTDDVP